MATAATAKISLNVALCSGSIPRSDLLNGPVYNLDGCNVNRAQLEGKNVITTTSANMVEDIRQSVATTLASNDVVEVPAWATIAEGDARLEPICEAVDTHAQLSLTSRASFVIGRSPTANLQLLHRTCSRMHALLVHHSNGSFLIKDLGSGHGTYVNGSKLPSKAWHKLKKGSLIRFGGNDQGAPAFLFKSFVGIGNLVSDLDQIYTSCNDQDSNAVSCIKGGGGMACVLDVKDIPAAALTLLNTRMNACGQQLMSLHESSIARCAREHFNAKKRSYDDDDDDRGFITGENKYIPSSTVRDSTGDKDKDGKSNKRRKGALKHRVSFSLNSPQVFYPPSVTPDELSSDDEATQVR